VPRGLKKRQRTTWAGFIALGQAGDWTSAKVGENWRWLSEWYWNNTESKADL